VGFEEHRSTLDKGAKAGIFDQAQSGHTVVGAAARYKPNPVVGLDGQDFA
jgi:hypothetical protein